MAVSKTVKPRMRQYHDKTHVTQLSVRFVPRSAGILVWTHNLSAFRGQKHFTEFNVCGSVHRNNILIYIRQDATLHSLFYLEIVLHVSGGTSTHHQERIQLYLQHLVFVRPLLLPAAIAAGSSNGVTNTRCCRYSCMRSWWWVEIPLETCRAVSI